MTDPSGSGAVAAKGRAGARDRRRIAVAFTWGLVLTLLLVTGYVLTAVGIPYATTAGPMVAKVHPASWLAIPTVLLWGWASGGIGGFVGRVAITRPGLVAFGLATLLLLFQTAVVVKLPITPVVDTFVLALLLFVAIDATDAAERAHLATFLHAIMALNALLALVEYASGWRLTPLFELDGTVMTYEWRASALFGHPLLNAFVTGNYLVMLAFGATPRLSPMIRAALMGLSALALIAFGGRVALVVAVAMVALAGLLGGARMLAGHRVKIDHVVFAIMAMSVAVIVGVIFVDLGAADRFLDRFSNDYGSAQTRLSMLRIFGDLTWEQFLLWPDPELIGQAQREYSIRIGVESSEVGFVANYGLVVTIVFFVGLATLMRELVVATSPKALWSIVYFVAVMSTSLGIAAKTTVLAVFVLFILVLVPRSHPRPVS